MSNTKDFDVQWLDDVPENWTRLKLKFLCRINTGSKDTQDKLPDGKYPFFVRSPHVEGLNEFTHDEEAVMTAGDGVGVGKVFHYYKGKFAAHQRVYVFTEFKNVIGKFLYYYLMSNLKFEVLMGGAKSTVDSIRRPMLSEFLVVFPDRLSQQQIVRFLDLKETQINNLIQAKEKYISLLEQQRQSTITEAVTKGLNPNVKMKDSGVGWIGEIPEHWEEKKIKYLFYEANERNFNEDATLLSLFTSIGVKPRKEMEQKGNKAQTVINYKIVRKKDIVVNKLLAWMGAIGLSEYNGVTSPDYDVYRPLNTEKVEELYYHYYFRNHYFKGDCFKFGRGIMMMRWRTYPEQLKSILVPVPPKEEQIQIANYIEYKEKELAQTIKNIEKSIEKLKEYRQSLIYEAVTGKIDVRDMELD